MPAAKESVSLADRPRGVAPANKWLALTALCIFTGAAWLGAIERANYNTDEFLQQLNELEPQAREAAWGQSVSRESLRAEMTVDENGEPLPEPISIAKEEEIDHAWRPYASKRHLRLMLTGFGPVVYPAVLIGFFCAFKSFRKPAGMLSRGFLVICLISGVAVVLRGLSLGIWRHGWLA